MERSAEAQCALNNNPGGSNNAGSINCISYNNGVNNTGDIVNQSSGTITPTHAYAPITPGTATGISVVGLGTTLTGNITNSGTITNTVAAWGINIGGGATAASIFHGAGATLLGSITNNGTITSPVGINVEGSSVSGVLTPTSVSGSIINGVGAKLNYTDVAINLAFANFGGSIINNGTISGTGSGAINVLDSSVHGDIVNATGASITANGALAAIVLNGSASGATLTGSIINQGTISGAGLTAGIEVVEATAGGVTNSGTITAGYGIVATGKENIPAVISGTILNSGTITATAAFGAGIGVFGYQGGAAATVSNITNSGTITANTGISIGATDIGAGGIVNTGTGVIHANAFGIYVSSSSVNTHKSSIAGDIVNQGTITANTGILVGGGSTVTNGITNTGIITGSGGTAIDITGEGAAMTINQQAGTITGAIKLSGLGDSFNVTGGVINGNIVGTGSSGTVNFAAGAGNNFIYSNTISGVSAVNVNSGTLYDNNSITATNVNVNNGGALAPGAPNTIGTLAITGNLNFAAGGTYVVNVNPSTSSLTTVSGTATLGGAGVNAIFAAGAYISKQYTIVTATSLSGTFGALTNAGLPAGFTDALSTDATHAYLDLTMAAPSSPGGLNGNQQNVINALINSFNVVGGIPTVFTGLTAGQLTQLSGEVGASFAQGAFQGGNMFLNLMLNPSFGGNFNGDSFGTIGFADEARAVPPAAASAFAAVDRNKANSFDSRYGFWGAAFGGTASIDGNATTGSHDTNSQAYGFAAGLDYHATPDTILGFALGGGGTHWGLDQGLGSGRSDMFQAGVYAKTRSGAAYLSGALAYSFHDVTTDRTVTIAGTDMLEAKFKANMVSGRLEGGYRYAMPWFGVTPYGALQVQSIALPSYSETATSGSNQFALSYAAQTVTTTRTELGARLDKTYLLDRGTLLTVYSRAAWAHDFGNTASASAIFQTLPASNFTVNGAQPAPDGALLTAGAEYKLASGWSVLAKFDGEFSSTTALYSGTGVIRKVW